MDTIELPPRPCPMCDNEVFYIGSCNFNIAIPEEEAFIKRHIGSLLNKVNLSLEGSYNHYSVTAFVCTNCNFTLFRTEM